METALGTIALRAMEALFNGVWQGLAIAAALGLALRAMRRSNAATRHAAGLAGLIVLAALPLLHLAEAFRPAAAPFAPQAELLPRPIESFQSVSAAVEIAPDPAPAESAAGRAGWQLFVPGYLAAALTGGWLAIALLRLARLAWQCHALRRIKRASVPPLPEMRAQFDILRGQIVPSRTVGLGLAADARTPVAAGFFHPMVLVPRELETERPAWREAILRHELAHVRRWDDWTNLLQQSIHAVFFFHPGIRWLSRRVSVEREIACDDHALAALASRRDYALLLTEFAGRMRAQDWAAAPGAWSKQGQLTERITMIMNQKRNVTTRLAGASAGILTAGAVAAALFIMQGVPRIAFADDAPGDAAAPRAESSDSTEIAVTSGPKKKELIVIAPHPAPEPSAQSLEAAPPLPPRPPAAPALPPNGYGFGYGTTQPPAPRDLRRGDAGLEDRLERLEKLVEKLARDRKEIRKEEFYSEIKPGFHPDPNGMFKGEFKPPGMDLKFREMARAQEALGKEFQRKLWNWNYGDENTGRVAAKARRQALEAQRKALEMQLEGIEHQLDAMKHQQQARDQDQERAARDQERVERDQERVERDRNRADRERSRTYSGNANENENREPAP